MQRELSFWFFKNSSVGSSIELEIPADDDICVYSLLVSCSSSEDTEPVKLFLFSLFLSLSAEAVSNIEGDAKNDFRSTNTHTYT